MALKQVTRSATVAFSPTSNYIVAGTMAGAIDMSFSTSACVELFKLDFTSEETELPVVGTAPATERLNRLSWGTTGIDSGTYPHGIIAGGLVDGSVLLWNPASLIGGKSGLDNEEAIIKKLTKHTGSVRGLEFNTFSPNLLASGAEDGELGIWDLTNPSNPSLYPALKGGGAGATGEISYLAWNKKVQHILASTSYNGTSVVWDLKRQKPVISFTDPTSRRRCSVLQWNPEVATQLIVASDDDRSPSLQVWDLRNSISPLRELTAHTKGVLSMAWCPSDSGLLLTCGKDNRTLCWDTNSGEVLLELPSSTNWNFDVQWSPRIPGLLSTSSFDGKLSIYNVESFGASTGLEGTGFESVGSAKPAFGRAPKWLKRPNGVSFAFGGKLVSFGPKKPAAGSATSGMESEVKIQTIVTEESLVKRSADFESAVAGGEKEHMKKFCQDKAAAAESEEEKETWSFLRVLFEEDARRQLLKHLNFEPDPTPAAPASDAAAVDGAEAALADEATQKLSVEEKGAPEVTFEAAAAAGSDALEAPQPGDEDFFDNLQTPATPPPGVIDKKRQLPVEPTEDDKEAEEEEPKDAAADEEEEGAEAVIQRALVVGNYESAVKACLDDNRMADALLLASIGGSDLWQATQEQYMKRVKRPYMRIVAAVVKNDLRMLVDSRPLRAWKETLALLCTYARSDEYAGLADALALRLSKDADSGYEQAATLCYICAGNIDQAVQMWSKRIQLNGNAATLPTDALQEIMEKAVVLGLATGQKRVSSALSSLVCKYAELLVGQGRLATAMEYLAMVPSEQADQKLNVLRDRIYRSGQVDGAANPPAFPFEVEPVLTQAGAAAAAAAAAQQPTATATAAASYNSYSQQQQPSAAAVAPVNHQAPSFQTSAPSYGGAYNQPSSYGAYSTQQPQASSWGQPQAPQPTPPQQPGVFTPAPSAAYPPQQPTFSPTSSFSSAQQPFAPPQPFVPPQPAPQSYPAQQPTMFTPSSFVPQQPSQPPSFSAAGSAAPPMGGAGATPNMMMPAPPRPITTSVPKPAGFVPAAAPPVAAPAPSQQGTHPPMGRPGAVAPVAPVAAPVAPTPAPAAAGPPPTVQTADVSKVAPEFKGVVNTLTRIFNETASAGGKAPPPAKKREIDDNSKKLGALFAKLNSQDVSPRVGEKLQQLTQALDAQDYARALHIQVELTTSDWDECGHWLVALKRLIKTREGLR